MHKMIKKLINFYDKALCTACGAGYWPWGPGTMGAAFGVLAWWLACFVLEPFELRLATAAAVVVVTLISVPSINRLEREWGPDPSRVVIDEVVGVWVCLIAVPEYVFFPDYEVILFLWMLFAFMLFRMFDIIKPFGIRNMEDLPGGWGVMADDILAGIYGVIVMIASYLIIELLIMVTI